MAIIFQQIAMDSIQADGRRDIRYKYTDHLGADHHSPVKRKPALFDVDADLLVSVAGIESILAQREVQNAIAQAILSNNPDRVPNHQTQEEFDRRVLGRMMLIDDVHTFYAAYPMFQSVELRGGANANQRAEYLAISVDDYNLIEARFNNVSGIVWFLSDEKNQIWSELPGGFE